MSQLTCRDVVEFLSDYLACELDPAVRAELDAHLALCDECVAFIRSYEHAVRLGKAAFDRPDRPAEERVPRRLVEAILAANRR